MWGPPQTPRTQLLKAELVLEPEKSPNPRSLEAKGLSSSALSAVLQPKKLRPRGERPALVPVVEVVSSFYSLRTQGVDSAERQSCPRESCWCELVWPPATLSLPEGCRRDLTTLDRRLLTSVQESAVSSSFLLPPGPPHWLALYPPGDPPVGRPRCFSWWGQPR